MKNVKRALLLSAMGAALCLPTAYADVITQWNFNGSSDTTVPGGGSTPTPVLGSGSASLIGGTTGSFASGTTNSGSTDPVTTNPPNLAWGTTGYAAQGVGNETAGVQFMVSTVGYNNIIFNFDQRASNTSSRYWAVNYTIDGTSWQRLTLNSTFATANTAFGATGTFSSTAGDTWFKNRTIDFTGIAGVNNNANFGIQIVSSFDGGVGYTAANPTGTYSGSGTSRYDMVTFNGSLLSARNLFWNLATAGAWDTSAANWTGNATIFANGDNVTFNKPEGGTIAVTGTLTPAIVTVSAASGTYTFDTATTGGKISGAGATLVKSGNGTLVISGDNDFAGGTTISGGTIRIDSTLPGTAGTPLGSGSIALNGGTLQNVAATAATIPNTVTVGNSGGTINTGAQDFTVTSLPNLNGILTKTGSGNLVVAGNFSPGVGGGLNISSGNVILNQPASATINLAGGSSTLTGNLVINNPLRFNVNDAASITGTGEIQIVSTGTLVSNDSGKAGGTIAAPLKLNSTNVTPGALGTWSGIDYTPSDYRFTIGGTSGGGVTLNSPISGNAEVDLSNQTENGGGSGYLQLNAVNTYTGNTTLNAGTPTVRPYSVQLGVNNALPATGLIAGTKTGWGLAVFDMNGHNQQLGYLADGGNSIPGSKSLKITNEGTADSTLSLGGSVTPGDVGFSGLIADGATNKIAVVKNGTNTQLITGDNAYSGGTTISGGTLQIGVAGGTTGSLGSGPITNNATLKVERAALTVANISGTGVTQVTAANATLTASSIRQGGLTIGAGNTVTVAANGTNAGVSKVGNLNINATGKLDLLDNDLIISSGSLSRAQVEALVNSGANFGAQNGPGLVTSTAQALSTLTGLGTSTIGETVYAGSGSYGGQTVTDNDVLVKYTYRGDADLNGVVDFDDYFYIDTGFATNGNRWSQGDFDNNGVVDFDDYFYIDTAFATQSGAFLTAGLSSGVSLAAVPEPSTWVLGSLALLGLAGFQLRRGRRQLQGER